MYLDAFDVNVQYMKEFLFKELALLPPTKVTHQEDALESCRSELKFVTKQLSNRLKDTERSLLQSQERGRQHQEHVTKLQVQLDTAKLSEEMQQQLNDAQEHDSRAFKECTDLKRLLGLSNEKLKASEAREAALQALVAEHDETILQLSTASDEHVSIGSQLKAEVLKQEKLIIQ
jgi:hypothetical protein